jgi:hypothetical protein
MLDKVMNKERVSRVNLLLQLGKEDNVVKNLRKQIV